MNLLSSMLRHGQCGRQIGLISFMDFMLSEAEVFLHQGIKELVNTCMKITKQMAF